MAYFTSWEYPPLSHSLLFIEAFLPLIAVFLAYLSVTIRLILKLLMSSLMPQRPRVFCCIFFSVGCLCFSGLVLVHATKAFLGVLWLSSLQPYLSKKELQTAQLCKMSVLGPYRLNMHIINISIMINVIL